MFKNRIEFRYRLEEEGKVFLADSGIVRQRKKGFVLKEGRDKGYLNGIGIGAEAVGDGEGVAAIGPNEEGRISFAVVPEE